MLFSPIIESIKNLMYQKIASNLGSISLGTTSAGLSDSRSKYPEILKNLKLFVK